MWWLNDEYLESAREMLGIVEHRTVKSICEEYTGMTAGNGVTWQEVIHQATPYVFDFQFPLHNPEHREGLEALILKKYFFREICCEDVEEWKLRLDEKLNEIMPYYNRMYESLDYLVNIMDDVDYTRIFQEQNSKQGTENTSSTQNIKSNSQNSGTSHSNSTDNSEGEAIGRYSDTPQGQLTGLMNDTYLTNAQRNTEEKTSTSENTNSSASQNMGESDTTGTFDTDKHESGLRTYNEKVKGKMYAGSKAKIVMEYQKAIKNIDAEIIRALSDLFMNVYHSYDVGV